MTTYLRVVYDAPPPGEPEEALFEIDDANAVTRTVRISEGQRPTANSIEIMSHHSVHFAEYAAGRKHPCLMSGAFPRPEDYDAYWSQRRARWSVSDRATFMRLFTKSRPEISFQES